MCQMRGRGILRGGLGVVYLADNTHIGYNGPAVEGVNFGGAARRYDPDSYRDVQSRKKMEDE